MDIIQHFLNSGEGGQPQNAWALVRPELAPVLPCRVPVHLPDCDLTPVVQSLEGNQFPVALRFLELQRSAISDANPQQRPLHLLSALMQVELRESAAAWKTVQAVQAVRTVAADDSSGSAPTAVSIDECLVMATVALAANELQRAEEYASEAIAAFQDSPGLLGAEVLQDARADAMTVFAAIRLAQSRFYEADMLLQLAHEAHLQAGDMQQLAVDLILMADCEYHSGGFLPAMHLLHEVQHLLNEDLDPSRHFRLARLKQAVHERLAHWQAPSRRTSSKLSWN